MPSPELPPVRARARARGLTPGGAASSDTVRAGTAIYHFGNTADPIFTGTCTGVASTCYLTGYAMESKCHIGSTCVYKNPDIPRSVNLSLALYARATPRDRGTRAHKVPCHSHDVCAQPA